MSDRVYFSNNNFYKRYSHVESVQLKASKFSDAPPYTIVIPTFGRADLLKEAINSCLEQTCKGDFEILVVDNDPVRLNDTELIIASIDSDRIAYYKNAKNIGCLGNFNRCIELGRSEYLIMLHTDDLLDSNYLDTVIPLIEGTPGLGILVPGKRILRNDAIARQKGLGFLSRSLKLEKRVIKLREKDFCFYNTVGGPLGIVMNKRICMEIGGFDENLFPMSDYAFWVRMTKQHDVYYLPLELGTYRFYGNISSERGMQRNYIINEFYLINELIKDKPYRRLMEGYLYEYIHYRANKPGLDRDIIYKTITGEPYKLRIINKIKFALAIAGFTVSYIIRALKTRIRV